MARPLRLTVFSALIALGAFLWATPEFLPPAWGAWFSFIGSTRGGSPQYITAAVEKGEVSRVVTATGALNAIVNVEVGSQLSGQIDKVFVDFNDSVRKGQPLAELDQRSFKARLAEAEAGARMAEASVEIQKARLQRVQVDAADAQAQRPVLQARVDSAQVRLEAAERELKRKQTLNERGITSSTDAEDTLSKRDGAAAALREAKAIAAAQENVITGTRVDLQRAQAELTNSIATLHKAQAALEAASVDVDRTTIRSPIDGVVVGRNVNEGQTLATTLEARTVFIVAGDLRKMQIEAKVDETDIGSIRTGQTASFTVDAFPGRAFSATVRQIRKAPQVQQNVVTYTVVLDTDNPDGLLLPGMTAVARITVQRTGPVLKVPLAALRFTPTAPGERPSAPTETLEGRPGSVWVPGEDGHPMPVAIGTGEDDGSGTRLVSGPLREGDRVMVGEVAEDGQRRLFGIRIGL
jgi:HlyD family secretion protein